MFYRETEFKDTEIGRIPKDWDVRSLSKVAIIKGRIGWHGLRDEDYLNEGDYYLVRGIDFENGRIAWDKCVYVSREWYERDPNIQLREGDILITKDGSIGKVAFVDKLPKKATLGTGIFLIRAKTNEYLPKYVFYIMQSGFFKRFIESLKAGSTLSHLYQKDLVKFKFPLPPLEEQRKIAEILSTIDKAIQKTNEIIARTERLKKGLMQELLTKGLGHKEFKDTEIGKIPKDWEVVRLEDVTEKFISGGTPSTKEPRYWNGDIPWIRSVHITKYYIDKSMIEQYITKEGLENSASNIVPKGSLIVATRVGIGKSAVNLIDVAINQDLTGIVLNRSKVNPFYLVWYFHSPKIINLLEAVSRGTTIKGIPQDYIKKLLIPLPPLEEQKKIAQILSTVDKKLEIEKKEKEKLERIKRGFMDLLLTGKVRVCL